MTVYVYGISIRKATEGGESSKYIIDDVRDVFTARKINAIVEHSHSPYVGDTGVDISAPTRAELARAISVLNHRVYWLKGSNAKNQAKHAEAYPGTRRFPKG